MSWIISCSPPLIMLTLFQHTREIEENMQKVMNDMQSQRAGETDEETYQRAMRDPEIQEIMGDPLMRQILSDSQQDPRALMDHMKNPMVSYGGEFVGKFKT